MQEILQSPLFPMIMMFVVLYFFFLRPKQKEMKKQEEMRNALKKGDRVSTLAGIVGIVRHVGEKTVVVESDDSKLEFEKAAISRVIPSTDDSK